MQFSRALATLISTAWLMLYAGMWAPACSVYDGELIVSQKPGAVSSPTTPDASSSAPTVEPVQRDASGDPPGPDDPPAQPMGEVQRCGDGLITGNETCDISIAEGKPGACPTSCPSPADNPCAQRALNGSGCQATCVVLELVCHGGDHCCPGKCTQDNDPDCSPSCGDGIVQQNRGETCEKNAEPACITDASACDDKDVCTTDELTGSASNCNSACTHTKITTPKAGDGCCPDGANATSDSDCTPRCGNGVREADEQCDGGDGCDASCKIVGSADQMRCLASATTDCEKCACMNCTASELACRMSDNATSNTQCSAIVECARKNDCLGTPCYCGPGLCGLPYGPCKTEIETAAGSTDWMVINQKLNDAMSSVGKSNTADNCRVMQCRSTCRPPTSTAMVR